MPREAAGRVCWWLEPRQSRKRSNGWPAGAAAGAPARTPRRACSASSVCCSIDHLRGENRTVARPAVLLIDPVPERLEELSHGLAANGYEAVPVSDLALGRRFAKGLDEALIVTTTRVVAESPDPQALIAELHAGGRRTLVLLGAHPAEEEGLPETVSFLAMEGQTLVE